MVKGFVLLRLFSIVLLGLLVSCQQDDQSFDYSEACSLVVHDYAYLRDQTDGQGVANLFTHEGSFSIFGETFSGRKAIRERVIGAEAGPVTRHLISTIEIEAEAAGKARGVSYVTIYIGPRSGSTNPIEVEGFAGIGEYHDRFVIDAGECLIESREFVPVFTYQDK